MFEKEEPVKEGPSFPFIEQTDKEIILKYDSFKIDIKNDSLVVTFIQDDVPMYAYTFANIYPGGTIIMDDLAGKVKLKLIGR